MGWSSVRLGGAARGEEAFPPTVSLHDEPSSCATHRRKLAETASETVKHDARSRVVRGCDAAGRQRVMHVGGADSLSTELEGKLHMVFKDAMHGAEALATVIIFWQMPHGKAEP